MEAISELKRNPLSNYLCTLARSEEVLQFHSATSYYKASKSIGSLLFIALLASEYSRSVSSAIEKELEVS